MASATDIVRATLMAACPPDVPAPFARIVKAESAGRGAHRVIAAELEMIDGLPATVELRPWAYGWSHRFTEMPGGPLSYEGGAWVRVEPA